MSVRPPQSFRNPGAARSTGLDILGYELMAERADALGRHGLKVEKAIGALQALDDPETTPERREALLDAAADVVWSFFIQREMCGLRSNRDAIERYRIPKEVVARLGVVRKPAQI
ncbi:hypothetical protein ASG25_07050 [Rhizobium sp. Leaf384]|uniref:DUF6665 family protein n=1 Tax=unclassified Rhizobium TaxID=2613769 RepID=UPI0007157516|nr:MULTISPECIES: DUF6665 family protein [unclassified Rhizobium]KQS81235.1 hypothetical protein ASG25_07050 [Rhizobium sp. Leaf384]KQS87144.1 hypothetical protein ASG58_02615 [Rhizobium sp. Leaf383]